MPKKEKDSITKAISEYLDTLWLDNDIIIKVLEDPELILEVIKIMKKWDYQLESRNAVLALL